MSTPTFPFLEKRAKIFSSARVSLKIFEISQISKFQEKNLWFKKWMVKESNLR